MAVQPRVVSLVPSVTESLRTWGIEPVAVTRFCPAPHPVAVGGTKDPDVGAVVGLRPDLVVMCVEENRQQDAEALEAAGLTIVALDIRTVDDVVHELARLAAVLGRDVGLPALPDPLPPDGRRAFVPIWRRPWMTIRDDTYAASVLGRVGIGTVFTGADERYPSIELEDAVARHPDLVVAPDEPFPFAERHRPELARVAPVVFVDGQDLLWWGTRTPGALRRLASQPGISRPGPG